MEWTATEFAESLEEGGGGSGGGGKDSPSGAWRREKQNTEVEYVAQPGRVERGVCYPECREEIT